MKTAAVATARLVVLYARTSLGRRGVVPAVLLHPVLGGLAGAIPTALQARASGAGLGLGASYGVQGGLLAAMIAGPVLIAALAACSTCDSQALQLAGWSAVKRFCVGLLAAAVLLFSALAAAAVSGAVVGAGDSLRKGTTLLTTPEPVVVPLPPLWTGIALAGALTLAGLSTTRTVGVVLGGWGAFLALLPATRGTPWRILLEASPFGPAWATAYRNGSYRLELAMTAGERSAVTLAWVTCGLATVILARSAPWRARRRPPQPRTVKSEACSRSASPRQMTTPVCTRPEPGQDQVAGMRRSNQ